jgi:pyridoxal phosphate enzyme (YggS family)
LSAIPNLHTVQTVSSQKLATALNKNWPDDRESLLNVLIQVNTSGEDSKSGVSPQDAELVNLARFVVDSCPRLYLHGLMTIGSLSESLSGDENRDFDLLKKTRDELQATLKEQGVNRWGKDGELILSMGMSSDFEAALRAGGDIVRVGTGIFGERIKKIP